MELFSLLFEGQMLLKDVLECVELDNLESTERDKLYMVLKILELASIRLDSEKINIR